jgi:2-phospho-L-lactate/phosphoenolpyruvate guanylyltransferase
MTSRSICAVVPIKPFGIAKRRLMPVLSSGERALLARLMLEDVLDVLVACTVLSGIIVITRDEGAGRIAHKNGARVLDDPALDLNSAVSMAINFLSAHRDIGMLVVPSDIPLLPSRLVQEMANGVSCPGAVAVVPATRDGGTNLLACRPVDAIRPSFGADSFRRHCRAACDAGIVPTVLMSEDAGLDIDRPEDLIAFLSRRSLTRSQAFLATLDIEGRLQSNTANRNESHHRLKA